MPPSEEPILFLWSFSAWAQKIVAYLALRKIPHSRCEQPITLPRPDLTSLGVQYRRIPVLAIGRDIYCDTLRIIEALEKIYPPSAEHPAIGVDPSKDGSGYGIERLFEKWTDIGFKAAAAVIPTDMELMKDPGFQKDREELWGRKWDKETQDALRAAAEANMRENFELLEAILGDGRNWILGGSEGPKLADIHACWIFDWLLQIPGSFEEKWFSSKRYPRTFAWRERYNSTIAKAREANATPTELSGSDATARILDAKLPATSKVEADPLGLKQGQQVEAFPIDTGYNCKDTGSLVGLTSNEIVIESKTQVDGSTVLIHYPRWNFSVEAVGGKVNGK